ncbi:hypothetical protein [Rouxiella sp. Mn2063]|uniref:hypothetical protein n=1 Tax=Rouxiella sp. Mn2063 TaxID=3395262 RepID=UPI003BC51410
MLTDIKSAIELAKAKRDEALLKHIHGKYWPVHYVVTQFRNRLEVVREDRAVNSVMYSTRNFGTVNTDGVAV